MNSSHKGTFVEFSCRLVSSMKRAGYSDTRSPSGISISTLADLMHVSDQICRRYLRGDALPDYDKVLRIAKALEVSPGWLLFGEHNELLISNSKSVTIDGDLLHYILEKSHALYMINPLHSDDFPDFVLDLIKDISTIDTNRDTLKKIIDVAVSSICSFEDKKNKNTQLA